MKLRIMFERFAVLVARVSHGAERACPVKVLSPIPVKRKQGKTDTTG
jgi:hypothetical protein